MNKHMSAGGGSAFGGKKFLFAFSAIVLLAAGCSSTQPVSVQTQTPTTQTPKTTSIQQNQTTTTPQSDAPTTSSQTLKLSDLTFNLPEGWSLESQSQDTDGWTNIRISVKGDTTKDGIYMTFKGPRPYDSSEFNNPSDPYTKIFANGDLSIYTSFSGGPVGVYTLNKNSKSYSIVLSSVPNIYIDDSDPSTVSDKTDYQSEFETMLETVK